MENFSQENIEKNCPHCQLNSFAYEHPIEKTNNFIVTCDVHPLVEGNILIIPKQHLSCVGEFSKELFGEFLELYTKYLNKLNAVYGQVASFEHGKIGQTVFHSHVHLLPFQGSCQEIVPEGKKYLKVIEDLNGLIEEFKFFGQYLFFTVGREKYLVDVRLGVPRFFRDRFAKALGYPEKGDWKNMHNNLELMEKAEIEIKALLSKLKST